MQRVSKPFHCSKRIVPAAFFVALFFGMVFFLALLPHPAAAVTCSSTVTVANNSDSGAGSLRQAISDICAGGTINFAASLTSSGPATITLTGGELGISKNMTITGPGPNLLAVSGGGVSRVFNVSAGVNATIGGLTIRDGNTASGQPGGGILNSGALTVTNSAIITNTGHLGGGIYSGGSLTVTNSYIGDSYARLRGGGVSVASSGATVINSTIANNRALLGGSFHGLYATIAVTNSTLANSVSNPGGIVLLSEGGSVSLANSALGQSGAGASCAISASGTIFDGGGNIADDNSCGFTAATSRNNTDPLLSPPGDYGGDTQTMALLPGSPAIDSALAASCPGADQRGVTRPQGGGCDSGAFESRGFTMAITGGSPQTALIYSAFAEPLAVTVSSTYTEPVGPGGVITFTPPAAGAGLSVITPFTATTDASGLAASGVVTANAVVGSYAVTPTVGGNVLNVAVFGGLPPPTVFNLTNQCNATDTVTSTDDDGAGTLRRAMLTLCPGGTIGFDASLTSSGPATITLTGGELGISKNMTITGPGPNLLAVSGGGVSRVFNVSVGVNATIGGLTIRDGSVSGNGGGILNAGVLTVTNSALLDNILAGGNRGSAIYNGAGPVTLANSTVAGNRSSDRGGGIYTTGDGLFAITNTTFYSNTGSMGGALSASSGNVAVTNSTFSGNSATTFGAAIRTSTGIITLTNTIIERALLGSNCAVSGLTDGGGNIDAGSSCGFTAARSRSNTNPMLSPLSDYGGGTQTFALLPGSPAIDSALAVSCPGTDQRGVVRVQNSCDSGAFESQGFLLAVSSGSPQTTTVYSAFAAPLSVQVSSGFNEPVGPGGVITFTPPSSSSEPGLSVTDPFTAVTNASGLAASGVITANAVSGSYGVTATVRGEGVAVNACGASCGGPMVFNLTNTRIAPSVLLTSQPNPSVFAESVMVTATVATTVTAAGAATGQIDFFLDGVMEEAVPVNANGQAIWYTSFEVGSYTLTAEYGGNASFTGATSSGITQVVNKAPSKTTLEAQPNPAFYGDKVSFLVQVKPQNPQPTALKSRGLSGPVVITDTTGIIYLNGWAIDGEVTVSGGIIPAGIYEVVASFAGDNNYEGSSSQLVRLVVNKHQTSTALASSSNPAFVGESLRFTVGVGAVQLNAVRLLGLAMPTGAVVITDTSGVLNLGGELVNGAVVLPAQLAEGTYTLTATYLGDARYAASVSTALVQVVKRHETGTALSVAPIAAKVGEAVQFMAAVNRLDPTALISGGPSGVVEFFASGATLGSAALANGQATLSVPATSAGVFTITAIYNGDSVYAQSTSAAATLTVTRRDTATALTIAPNPAKARQDVTLTVAVAELMTDAGVTAATVPLQPGGEVIFRSAGAELGRAGLANGQATLRTATLPVGQHVVVAEYGGDDAFAGSASAPVTLTVQPMPLAVNDAAGAQGGPVTIDVTANDLDPAGGGLTILSVSAPGHGQATITPGGPNVIYTPAAGFTGTDSFTYEIVDANGNRDDALVAVVVTHAPEGQGKPQVQAVNPVVDSSATFTTPMSTLSVQAPAGFFTPTLGEKDILFLSFTPVITPSQQTSNPPANLRFGNLEFNLSVYLNNRLIEGQTFARPLLVTINYDPALLGGLNAETLGLWYWNGTAWSTDGIAILSNDVTNHTVTVSISHFSQLAFFAAAPTGLDPGDEPLRPFNLYLPAMNK